MSLKLKHKAVRSGGSLRILIPRVICEDLGIKEGDILEIWIEEDVIHMRKNLFKEGIKNFITVIVY